MCIACYWLGEFNSIIPCGNIVGMMVGTCGSLSVWYTEAGDEMYCTRLVWYNTWLRQ